MIDDSQVRTIWCGNLPENIPDEIVYELFHQAGPLDNVSIPRDREGRKRNFCFITYSHIESLPYAIELFRGTSLYGRQLAVQPRSKTVILDNCLSEDLSYLLGRTPMRTAPSMIGADRIMDTPPPAPVPSFRITIENDPLPQDPYSGLERSNLSGAALRGHWNSRLVMKQERPRERFYPYADDRVENGNRGRNRRSRERDDRSDCDRPKRDFSHRQKDRSGYRRN